MCLRLFYQPIFWYKLGNSDVALCSLHDSDIFLIGFSWLSQKGILKCNITISISSLHVHLVFIILKPQIMRLSVCHSLHITFLRFEINSYAMEKNREEESQIRSHTSDKPVLLWVFIQCFDVSLEDCLSILIAGVSIHELIKYSDKTKGEHGVIPVWLLVLNQMLLDNQLLQHSVVNTRDWSLIRFKKIQLCVSYSRRICTSSKQPQEDQENYGEFNYKLLVE